MNTQINENFVSFEVAKLLKEKGFDCSCEHQYINCSSGYPFLTDIRDDAGCYYKNSEIGQDEYSAPTIQMAMKWLREVHHWHIAIERMDYGYYADIVSTLSDTTEGYRIEAGNDATYEQACEAAIWDCLTNLI